MDRIPRIHFTETERPPKPSRADSSQSGKNGALSINDFGAEKEVGLIKEDVDDSIHEEDFKHRQVFKGWTLAWLAYQCTGVIYGDIGTSPLYVYSSTFTSDPSYDDLLGALSLIIWTLTLIVTVKYVLIVLQADDEGEGGTFAMYSLLSRFSNIMKRDPKTKATIRLERYSPDEMSPANLTIRGWLENSKIAHAVLKIFAVFGVSLIMADGVLTPAQSVLGAIQGLEVVVPDISTSTIIGTTCGILIVLFLLQPLGITKLGSAFAPIVIIWLAFNMGFGIYNLAQHDASVLKAFSPYFAGAYFVRNKTEGWKSLGGILLAFTGVEALFADLGAFSKRAIQISWLCFVYPCLLLAYIGQAAYISEDPSAYSNPFFKCLPPGMFYPSLVVSILAAVVASQAMITSTFQLISQVMHASYFPQIRMIYTSTNFHGQVYIPWANWLLMIGTVLVTAVYNNTTRLGEAYGVCVILVTTITTCMITLVAIIVWRLHLLLIFMVALVFITFDSLYLSSALTKFPDGAWFTLLLALILASIFMLWRYGKEHQWAAEARQKIPLSKLIEQDVSLHSSNPTSATSSMANLATDTPRLRLSSPLSAKNHIVTRIPGMGIFFDKAGDAVPTVTAHFLSKFEALPDVPVFLHMRALALPSVPENEKYSISPAATGLLENAYRLIVRHGYNDRVVSPDLGRLVYEQIRLDIVARSATRRMAREEIISPSGITEYSIDQEADDSKTAAQLAALDAAFETQTVYMVGKEQLRIMGAGKVDTIGVAQKVKALISPRRMFLEIFLWIRENTRARVASWKIPVDKLVEVGFVLEI